LLTLREEVFRRRNGRTLTGSDLLAADVGPTHAFMEKISKIKCMSSKLIVKHADTPSPPFVLSPSTTKTAEASFDRIALRKMQAASNLTLD